MIIAKALGYRVAKFEASYIAKDQEFLVEDYYNAASEESGIMIRQDSTKN